jgi:transcriptional regulator with XRE-family HTH domain
MSQERLAEAAGLTYKYLGRIELAKADPGADVLVRLARALAVPVGELFETITPTDTVSSSSNTRNVSPADAESLSVALATLTTAVERVLAHLPPPLLLRAPRRTRS